MDRALQPDNAPRRDQATSSRMPATGREASNDPDLNPKTTGLRQSDGLSDGLRDGLSDRLSGGLNGSESGAVDGDAPVGNASRSARALRSPPAAQLPEQPLRSQAGNAAIASVAVRTPPGMAKQESGVSASREEEGSPTGSGKEGSAPDAGKSSTTRASSTTRTSSVTRGSRDKSATGKTAKPSTAKGEGKSPSEKAPTNKTASAARKEAKKGAKEDATGAGRPAATAATLPAIDALEMLPPLFLAPLLPAPPATRPKQYDVAAARVEASIIVGQLSLAAERRKATARDNAAATKEQIAKDGIAQRTVALVRVTQSRLNIAAEVRKAQASVNGQVKGWKAAAQTQAAAGFAQVVDAGKTQADAVRTSKETYQHAAHKLVSDKQTETRKFGESEGKRGSNAVKALAKEAQDRGNRQALAHERAEPNERGQVQANAVREAANTMAAELLKPAAQIESKATEQGEDLADGFSDAADKAVESMEEQAGPVIDEVLGAAPGQLATFQEMGTATGHAIEDLAKSITDELSGVEKESNAQLNSVAVALTQQIDTAIATLLASVDQQVVALEQALDQIVERAGATALAAKHPDPDGLRKAMSGVEEMLDDACSGFAEGLAEMEGTAAQTFADAITTASSDLARVESAVSGNLARIAGAATGGMQALVQKQKEGIDKFLATWNEGLAAALKEVNTKWDSLVAGVGEKIEEALRKGKPGITQGVEDSLAEARKPLDDLDDKMKDAAEGAAYKYDHPIRYKIKRVLLAIAKAIVALVAVVAAAILAVVLIIAGIISGAIWAIVLGVIILVAVVGFVLYGLISGIVRRIRSARSVFDGVRGFFVGILDITGIPGIIEGITETDIVNGDELTVEDASERMGGGIVALVTFIIPFAKGLKGVRGAPRVPIEVGPVDVPVRPGILPEVPVEPEPVPPEVAVEPRPPSGAEIPETGGPEPGAAKTGPQPADVPEVEPSKPQPPTVEPPEGKAPAEPAEPAQPAEPAKPEPPKPEPAKVEPPKAEPPKAEPPKAEPHKPEPPQVEPPQAEPPKTEPPKVEPPKVEPPKEPPKAEPPETEPQKKAEEPPPAEKAPEEKPAEEKAPDKTVPEEKPAETKAKDEATAEIGEEPEAAPEATESERVPPEKTKHWKDVEPFIGKDVGEGVPKGYRVFERGGKKFIRRIDANPKEFPRLTVEEGKIKVGKPGSTRISKPGALAKALGERPLDHQAHHVVPDEIVRDEPLFKEARKRGYDVDRKSNGAYLPEDAAARAKVPESAKLPLHSGSHPVYNSMARDISGRVLTDLLDEFPDKTLEEIPTDRILKAAGQVETLMRDALNKWTVSHGEKLN